MSDGRKKGFTLVELMIALALTGIVMASIYKALASSQKVYTAQDQVVETQENVRAAMDFMVRGIRMAGYNPAGSATAFGFVNDASTGRITSASSIAFDVDDNEDGNFDDADEDGDLDGDPNEQVAFRLNVGGTDSILRRYRPPSEDGTVAAQWTAVAENIAALGFAYAYDNDGDGQLDQATGGGNTGVIWAVDSDSDGDLDRVVDTNYDGVVDTNDSTPGQALASSVGMARVRAVKIWILGRTRLQEQGYTDNNTYAVSNQRITPVAGYRYRLSTATVNCRNMGL
jgi:type IV pilus assembly protein PilW